MIKSLLLAAALLFLTVGLTHAQTCVQADVSHPTQAVATWKDNSGDETGFVLERSLNGGVFSAVAASLAANLTTYTDSTVVRDPVATNTYTYRIKAIKALADGSILSSPYAAETPCISFLPPPPSPPAAPSGFTLSALSQTQIQASWSDNSDNETEFQINLQGYSPPRSIARSAPTNATNLVIGGLQKNKTYCGANVAMNGTAQSDPSNQSCATTLR